MGDISKLPKWAREKIETLERQKRELVEQIKAHGENAETNIVIGDFYTHGLGPKVNRFIDDRETVCLRIGPDRWISFRLDSQMPGKVYASAVTRGGSASNRCLLFRPWSSNCAYLEIG